MWTNMRGNWNTRRVLDYFVWLTTTPRHKYCNMLSIVSPFKIIRAVSGYGTNDRGLVLGRNFLFATGFTLILGTA